MNFIAPLICMYINIKKTKLKKYTYQNKEVEFRRLKHQMYKTTIFRNSNVIFCCCIYFVEDIYLLLKYNHLP